ncbi:hypothetical protein C8K36_10230 [Rhodococcus sp. OK519]|nr:hypothetical protein C8K36_10230 [Rhodococcus sp. OK519]
MDVDKVTDELYGLEPSSFVAARTARVEEARAKKDREAVKAVSALKKPTVVGWLVNLLSRERPEDVDAVLSLGDALRTAQRRLDPAALRELTTQRQRVVRALAESAGELAAQRDRVVGEAALRDVAQTLHAAMADPDLARTVRRGRVLGAATYSGFGPAGLESVPEEDDSAQDVEYRPDPAAGAVALAELEAARASEEKARVELDARERDRADARGEVEQIADRLRALDREREHLAQRGEFARQAERTASDAVRSARSGLEEARAQVAAAEAAEAAVEEP